MKLEFTEGCTCTSLAVDGMETIDMKLEDLQDVICKLIKRESDLAILQDLFYTLMESQGDYEFLGICDECGDSIRTYKLELQ